MCVEGTDKSVYPFVQQQKMNQILKKKKKKIAVRRRNQPFAFITLPIYKKDNEHDYRQRPLLKKTGVILMPRHILLRKNFWNRILVRSGSYFSWL
jgi:hypothetical protein